LGSNLLKLYDIRDNVEAALADLGLNLDKWLSLGSPWEMTRPEISHYVASEAIPSNTTMGMDISVCAGYLSM
jgi:hypothetical protein